MNEMNPKNADKMNESALPELPGGWVWTKLEEISDIIFGQSPPSSTYNENRASALAYVDV